MRRNKFKRVMNESNLITIMEEEGKKIFRKHGRLNSMKNISASEDESGYSSSRSSSLTPPCSPVLRLGRPDQFSKFASGAGAGLNLNKKSQEVGVFHSDRRDQWRDKVGVRFHTAGQLG